MTAPEVHYRDKWDMKRYRAIFSVLFICFALTLSLILLEVASGRHFFSDSVVLGYNIFEFMSLIVAFSIFLIAFYTYNQSMNMQLVIPGFTFLMAGLLDVLHLIMLQAGNTFFEGIQLTRIPEGLMMLSRGVNAVGFLLLVIVPEKKKNNASRGFITILSLLFVTLCMIVLYFVPYFNTPVEEPYRLALPGQILLILVALIYAYNVYRAARDFKRGNDPLKKVLACAFIIMFFSQLISLQASDLEDLRSVLSSIFKFAAFILYFNLFYIHNIRRPYILLSKAKEELNAYTYELDCLVDKRTHEFKMANRRLMADLEVARGIQKSMLPTSFPQSEFVSFTAGYLPAENLSGDFYNVFKIDDSRYGVCIGDVSGHGVSAAMLTVFTFQKIQSLLEELGTAGMTIPSMVLQHLYDSFNGANFSEELYIVMIYGVYNSDTGIFSYASGGLNTVPFRLRPDGSIQELDSDGYAICKLGEIMKPKFVNHQIMLFPGDKLLLYTDGVVEAVNEQNQPYTKERLKEILARNNKWSAQHLADAIMEDVSSYSKTIRDDITFLILDVQRPF